MQLSSAIKSGDYHIAWPLMKHLSDNQLLNIILTNNKTPLHYACQHGRLDILEQMLAEFNFDAESTDNNDVTPLHIAAEHGHLDIVRYLVNICHCNVEAKDDELNMPLHWAAYNGHLDVVKFFIEDVMCEPSPKTKFGMTPLHNASKKGCLDVVKYLIEKCYLESQDHMNNRPIHWAAYNGHVDVVKFLIEEAKAEANPKTSSGATPLIDACKTGQLKVARYLINSGHCDVSQRDNRYNTPLHWAAYNGHLEIVRFIIEENKCDSNPKNTCGITPLHDCSRNGHLEVVKCLVDTHHCDPIMNDDGKNTPLHYAASNGHLEVVKYFIQETICDPNIRNDTNNTPLHGASKKGRLATVKYLAAHCDTKLVNQEGQTAYDVAKSDEVASFLATAQSTKYTYSARLYKASSLDTQVKAIFTMCPDIKSFKEESDRAIADGYSGMSNKAEGMTVHNALNFISDKVNMFVESVTTNWTVHMDKSFISKEEIDIADKSAEEYPPRIIVYLTPAVSHPPPAVLTLRGVDRECSFLIAAETGVQQVDTSFDQLDVIGSSWTLGRSTSLSPHRRKSRSREQTPDGPRGAKPSVHESIAERLDQQLKKLPTMSNIVFMRNTSGETYELINKMSGSWKKIGLLLELDYGLLCNFEDDRKRDEDRLCDVLGQWFSNAPGLPNYNRYPLTWRGLYNLLSDAKLTTYANDFIEFVEESKLNDFVM